jgi:acetylornithine deacetylase
LALQANSFDSDIPWSVPLVARVRLYFQFLPHEDVPGVIAEIRESIDDFCRNDSFFSVYVPKWRAIFDPPLLGHELDANHDLTTTLSRSVPSVLGTAPVVTAAEYPCDAFLNQLYFGMPTLIFGPRGAGPHNANEYVEVKSVLQTAEILLATTMEWCG